ncbi:MAG TPA: hypothetical protein VKW78_00125 [Terriglobales bacterium]|jgi:hypothetical protein|nr:hypothetical protein [Terriglobales bacterium]
MRKAFVFRCVLLLAGILALSSGALAQVSVGVSVRIGPPPLPVYEQPVCPGEGYIWIPGYWAWGPGGFFWVPGTWVLAPRVGWLWTPGYWGWGGGVYVWHPGYWGPHVGFYGGINYGFGYTGVGYAGGYWRGGAFVYNRAVTNVNVTVVHNTYNQTVINNNVTINRVSYNGGAGGVNARPTASEQVAAREQHMAATPVQTEHERASSSNRALLASANHGQPPVAATARPGVFAGRDVVPSRPGGARATERPGAPGVNARNEERPPARNGERPAARGEARPAPRGESRPVPRTDERPSARENGRPNAPEQRAQPAPKGRNQPEGRERRDDGQGRR